MKNSRDYYRFNDFTLVNYRNLLKLALENYEFAFFNEKFDFVNKTILLRHDLEFSVPIALKMAKIENSLGIRATYFIQLHGDFYNALEKRTFEQLKRIETLGHQLALHFDTHFWDIKREDQLNEYLEIDKSTFEILFIFHPLEYLEIASSKFSLFSKTPFKTS